MRFFTRNNKKLTQKQKRHLVQASGSTCFYLHDGYSLYNLRELHHALKTMSSQQYSYHANPSKNDFASWVDTILRDHKCAHSLRSAQSQEEAALVTERFLADYI